MRKGRKQQEEMKKVQEFVGNKRKLRRVNSSLNNISKVVMAKSWDGEVRLRTKGSSSMELVTKLVAAGGVLRIVAVIVRKERKA